ncbi:MAG: hypothetical protein ACYDCF_08820 [Burkholderiales bacterium]
MVTLHDAVKHGIGDGGVSNPGMPVFDLAKLMNTGKAMKGLGSSRIGELY